MNRPAAHNKLSRRVLFAGAGAGTAGAVAALATVLPAARQPQAEVTLAPREAPEGGGGYALTEHVKRYYKTAGV